MIYSQTGGFQGLSFAIPIDEAIRVKDQLVKTGHVSRGRLGVSVQGVNQTLASSFGLKQPQGALISSVEPGGPAAKAGLKAGDVILQVNGTPVLSSSDLPAQIAAMRPGSTAKLQVWRDKATQDVNVTLGAFADGKTASNDAQGATQGRLGVAVRGLTPQEQRMVQANGLLVQDVAGPAAAAGVQPGDVILAVNGQPVATPAQLAASIVHAASSVALLVQRDAAQIFIPVDLG
ncbi:hypothetical protein DFQ30_002419 [Apophysomyces sp. BC1015]|nr:hypothetical protein DFQ30_002419 [Apophysomyces sp. BC1015]